MPWTIRVEMTVDDDRIYRVTVGGVGFTKTVDGVEGTYGFFVNCFVKASTAARAEIEAISALRQRADLRRELDASTKATITVEEVVEQTGATSPGVQGLLWYREESES